MVLGEDKVLADPTENAVPAALTVDNFPVDLIDPCVS